MTQFIHGLPDLLPCAKCRVHFRQEIAADPVEPHVGSRAAIEKWLVDLHNRVNARLEKPQLTRDEAAQLMKGDIVGEDPTPSSASDATIIGLAVAVAVMGVLLIIMLVSYYRARGVKTTPRSYPEFNSYWG